MKKMTAKEFQKLVALVKRRNKAFKKLTRAQQRVRIAKDVLEQIKLRKLKPAHMTYLRATGARSLPAIKREATDLGAVLEALPSCQVCALGGLFACAVKRADNLTAEASGAVYSYGPPTAEGCNKVDRVRAPQRKVYEYVEQFFAPEQRARIETWFEADDAFTGYYFEAPFFPFAWKQLSARRRMEEIMRNIVANKGAFKPEQLQQKYAD